MGAGRVSGEQESPPSAEKTPALCRTAQTGTFDNLVREKTCRRGLCWATKGGMMPRHVCHGSRPPRMKGMGAGAYPSCRSGSYHDGRGGKHSRELPLGPTERESPTLADWQRQPVLPWSFKTKVPLVTNKRYRGGVSTGRGPPFSVANGVACACGRAARSVEPRRHRPGPDPARSEPPLEPVMVPRHPPSLPLGLCWPPSPARLA